MPLQGELAAQGAALRDALAQAVANNIAAGQAEAKPIQWLGKTVYEMSIKGKLPSGEAAFAQARFFEHQGVLYEVLMMGPGEAANPDSATSWFIVGALDTDQ